MGSIGEFRPCRGELYIVPWAHAGLCRGRAVPAALTPRSGVLVPTRERNTSVRITLARIPDARGRLSLHLDNDRVAAQT
jgi:hypothetical protein